MKINKLLTLLLLSVAVVACNGGGGGSGTGNGGSGGSGSGSGASSGTLKIVHSMPINQIFVTENSIVKNLKANQVYYPIDIPTGQGSSVQFNGTALTYKNNNWNEVNFYVPAINTVPSFLECSVASNNDLACLKHYNGKQAIQELNPNDGTIVNEFFINDGTSFPDGDGVLDIENKSYISFSGGYYCELNSGTCNKYAGVFNSVVATGYLNNSYYAVYTSNTGENELKIFTGQNIISKHIPSVNLIGNGSMVVLDSTHFKLMGTLNTIYSCTIGDTNVTCDNGTNVVAGNSTISMAQSLFNIGDQLYIAGLNVKNGTEQSSIYSYNPK